MKIFFAGAEGGALGVSNPYTKIALDLNLRVILSYWYLNVNRDKSGNESPPCLVYDKSKVLVDSGGYTARKNYEEILVEGYAKFLNNYKIPFAFNLDVLSVKQTLKNQAYLLKKTKTQIIPIYHWSDWKENREILDDFIKHFKLIAIGGVANRNINEKHFPFFDYVFSKTMDRIKVHGLGIGKSLFLERYPFYSIDTSSWLQGKRWGRFNYIKDPRFRVFIGQSMRGSPVLKSARHLKNEITMYLQREKFITELWEKRGVKWGK